MRYMPIAAAISLFVAVSASTSFGQAPVTNDPRVADLLNTGKTALASGDFDGATDRFEAALVLAPGDARVYIALANVAREKGLQGRAIHYFREAQEADPGNLAAISGEGAAMAEKGATAKAERNLAKLQSMCGSNCAEAGELASVIARGPLPQVKSAEASPTMADPAARN
ncbi:tetratricopeptide repeat protein [Croceicoccus bisphenolivorans]|uniref:tetratricopeptide repeat protein n=1 Tax=Croceicoccus bisphenolivorans TaxID=1783232 RepID=UPI000B185DF5|nr:tetratricopeptide repeat protein [Croceicoccus bisphenolivorans]